MGDASLDKSEGSARSVAMTCGKRSGFYVLAPDGSLGEYRGKNKPDLKTMRGTRV